LLHKDKEAAEEFQVTDAGDTAVVWSVGASVRTVEDALAKAEIDLREWEVVKKTINSWPTSMKVKDADGEKPLRVWNWQIKLELRRRVPKPVAAAVRELLDELRKKPIQHSAVRRIKHRHMHLLEISLYDAHFGKRCWGAETGENYDLEIAKSDYAQAVDDLLARIEGWDVEKVILPIGNDFFHADNWQSTTAHGTHVDSVDDRFQRVFKVGCRAVEYAVRRAREAADVEVLWIPGNHDPSTSYYLCEWVAAVFAGDKHVQVDNGARSRKYRQYGATLLGYTHGDPVHQVKHGRLPLVMATDEPQAWAATTYRAWRCGHFHKRASFDFTSSDTFNGVRVDILPSISGTDKWHYEHGFVNNVRTAEAWLWSKEQGYVGHFSVLTASERKDRKHESASGRNHRLRDSG
jgi:hypothetical protein